MRRRSNTNRPHEPYSLYLDEGISGPTLASLLRKAKMFVFQYEALLTKNRKISDGDVIKRACASGFVLVSKDTSMEWDDGLEDIISNRARVIFITDQDGGPVHWASALICSARHWERELLNNPMGPLTISVNRDGSIRKVAGEDELRKRRNRLLTGKLARGKRHRLITSDGTYGKAER